MRKPLALVALMLTALGAARVAPQEAGLTAEIEGLEQKLVAAIGARDLATYDALVADDYVVVTASGAETTKAQVMAAYRSGDRGYRDLRIDEVKVHLYGDTAVLSARTWGFRIEGGTETPNRVRYLRVYARRQGQWKAVSQMSTPVADP
jgi:ketosteroid isomerase-like protein